MKKTYLTHLRVPLIGAALMLAVTSAPVLADPPPWAPAHGQRAKQVRQYNYVYYPERQLYYAPTTQQWFWLSNGQWQFGVRLPVTYRGTVSNGGIPLVLHSSRPYIEHVYVERTYGRPWRAKHKKFKQEKYKNEKSKHYDKHQDKHQEKNQHGHGQR